MCKRIILLFVFLVTLILSNSLALAQDLNNDGIVNVLDLSIAAKAFGSKLGDANWNEIADLDHNGKVDIYDINIIANSYKKETLIESKPKGSSSNSPLSVFSGIILWFKNIFSVTAVEPPPKTKLYVDPIKIVDSRLTTGKTFIVEINIYDVTDLYGWESSLLYNRNILKVNNIAYSNFLGTTDKTYSITNSDNPGVLSLLNIKLGYTKGNDGSGTLVNVTFQVIGEGESYLDLSRVTLVNSTVIGTYVGTIKNEVKNGYFSNDPAMNIQYTIMRPSSGTIVY